MTKTDFAAPARQDRRPVRVAVLVSGRGSNMRAILAAQKKKDFGARVVLVLSDKAEAPALTTAREQGITALWVDPAPYRRREDYDARLRDVLREHHIDLVVLAGFMRLLSRPMVDSFPNQIINVHPSLLPAFPGLQAPAQAINWGVKVSGCTVHFVDHGMDTGPIILQESVPVATGDTPEILHQRIQEAEHRLLPEAIKLFAAGRLHVEGRQVIISNPSEGEARLEPQR